MGRNRVRHRRASGRPEPGAAPAGAHPPPLLDDAGLVAYDDERGTVRLASLDETAREYIEGGIDAKPESTT
ncbi:hypothetical protein [Halolamina pelagica]|uniref:hypothetical protein n=1 Tax=Halolamina pelagica TaxID=699431 RepID=UPI0016705A8C|nr:hypothetical protein [Halolamina pelagica]